VGSAIVGWVAVSLGTVCIAAGVAVTVVEAVRRPPDDAVGAFLSVADLAKLGQAVAAVLKELRQMRAGAQLLVIGLVVLGGGVWLLSARPF